MIDNLFVLTWNTHNHFHIPRVETMADIVFISLQECFTFKNYDDCYLEYKYSYHFMLLGLHSLIFSKKKLNISFKKIGMGYFGFPNKGFITCLINNNILYINAHCIPHPYNQKTRMKQLKYILDSSFVKGVETIILSGDLNFRIVDNKDQASEFFEQFPIFKEAKINFEPTYKYKNNILNLSRTPSYCDRILICSKKKIKFNDYNLLRNIKYSDHKPVYLSFSLNGIVKNTNELLIHQKIVTKYREILTYIYQFLYTYIIIILFLSLLFLFITY